MFWLSSRFFWEGAAHLKMKYLNTPWNWFEDNEDEESWHGRLLDDEFWGYEFVDDELVLYEG